MTNLNDSDAGSLRQCLLDVDAGGTITFQAGVTGTITLANDFAPLTKVVTLTGPGAGLLTIDRNDTAGGSIFLVNNGGSLAANGLTLTRTSAAMVVNAGGSATLTNSIITDIGIAGAYSTGELVLNGVAISGSDTVGVYVGDGNTTLINSTVSHNQVGVRVNSGGHATLTNSTIRSQIDNGVEAIGATATLTNVTVSGNGGEGIRSGTGSVTLTNTILADNTVVNCAVVSGGAIINAANNLDTGTTCGFGSTNNSLSSTPAGLDPSGLQNNGGPTKTIALLEGSAAIDAASDEVCILTGPGMVNGVDQRGIARPQTSCDIGAYELRSFTLTTSASGPGNVTPASASYLAGSEVPVTATPNSGASFLRWTLDGNPAGSVSPLNVTMSGNRTVVGTFGYPLTVAISGSGAVGRDVPGIGGGPFGYDPGATVTLTATPNAGSTFVGWTVDGVYRGWANPLTLTMDAAHTVQATFATTKLFAADVPGVHPNFTAITELASRGNILGYGPANYGPGDGVQRAQMAALISRATPFGPGTPTNGYVLPPACVPNSWECEDWGNSFTDQGGIIASLWRAAGTLQHYQVAFGYTPGDCAVQGRAFPCYGPTDPVSHAQTIAFITRAMQAKGYWLPQPNAPLPDPGVPTVLANEARTYAFYTGSLPALPQGKGWNDGATRGWFAQALWQALNSYWGTDGVMPDTRPAGGMVP